MNAKKLKRFKKGKKYFFTFLDREENPLLRSNAYSSARTRDNGIQTVINNLDNLERKSEEGEHYFIVRTKTNQELARSVDFESVQEMEQAISNLLSDFAEKEDLSHQESEPAARKAGKTGLPPKYFFRLEYYPSEREPLKGKIEYPFGNEKTALEGLGLDQIAAFLRKHLPLTAGPEKSRKTSAAPGVEAAAGFPTSTPAGHLPAREEKTKTAVAAPENYIPDLFDVVPQGGDNKNRMVYWRDTPLELLIHLDKYDFSPASYPLLSSAIYAVPVNGQQKVLISWEKTETPEDNFLKMPLYIGNLPVPGIYRLQLDLELKSISGSGHPIRLMSSRMIQIN